MITTDLTPPRPNRQTKRSFLVLCEGEDQSAYLEWLKSAFGHPLLTIRQLPESSSPEEAVAHALGLRRSEKTKGTHFDEVWCMITVPTHDLLAGVLELQKPGGVRMAATVGTFTRWLELHWDKDEELPQVLVDETSSAGFAAVLQERVDTALRRASEEPKITTVDQLVLALDASSRTFNLGTIRDR